ARELVLDEMRRGARTIYVDFTGYDVIAHRAGPTAPEALAAARKLDHTIGFILRKAGRTPRTYRLVVLSDHGQSGGATFNQRYGEGLEDVLARLTGGRASVHGAATPAEHRHGGFRFGT